jgi:hypothetical protein
MPKVDRSIKDSFGSLKNIKNSEYMNFRTDTPETIMDSTMYGDRRQSSEI